MPIGRSVDDGRNAGRLEALWAALDGYDQVAGLYTGMDLKKQY